MADDTLVKVGLFALAALGFIVVYKLVTNDDSLSGAAKDVKGSVKGGRCCAYRKCLVLQYSFLTIGQRCW